MKSIRGLDLWRRFWIALLLACPVWLASTLLGLGPYFGRYLYSLSLYVPSHIYYSFIALYFISILIFIFSIFRNIENIKIKRFGVLKFYLMLVVLLYTPLLVTAIYFGMDEMHVNEQLNQRAAAVYQQLQLSGSPPVHHLPLTPPASEFLEYLFSFLIIFTVIFSGLYIHNSFLLYLCSCVMSMSLMSLYFIWQGAHRFMVADWFLLAGAMEGLACAAVLDIYRKHILYQRENFSFEKLDIDNQNGGRRE